MIGPCLALAGIIVSWIILLLYLTSIGQPPPDSYNDDDGIYNPLQPYHSVDDGEYYKMKWWYEEESQTSKQEEPNLKQHVALITGGNSGIGRGIAVELCKVGVGTVVITSRSIQRAKTTAQELVSSGLCQVNQIQGMEVDLADFGSVRELAADFQSNYDRLNYFVQNAGGIILPGKYSGPYITKDGFEALYAGNYLGHFLLLQLLLDLIESSSPARISLTSSIAHWGVTTNLTSLLPKTGFRARQSQEDGGIISGFEHYCNTKFLQVAMAFELQRRLDPNSNITIIPSHLDSSTPTFLLAIVIQGYLL